MAQCLSKPCAVMLALVLREQVRQARDSFMARGHTVSKSPDQDSLNNLFNNSIYYRRQPAKRECGSQSYSKDAITSMSFRIPRFFFQDRDCFRIIE